MSTPAKPPVAQLRIRLLDIDHHPLPSQGAVLRWGPDRFDVQINPLGFVIPFGADAGANPSPPLLLNRKYKEGVLSLMDAAGKAVFASITVHLADFDAPDTPEGAKARLNNLGYLALLGAPGAALPGMDQAAADGLMRFRQAKGLTPLTGGAVDAATRDALAAVHDT